MRKIIIGRNHQTNKMLLSVNNVNNGKPQSLNNEKPLPASVSREHVSITIHDDGKVLLENLNVQNYTFVNMVGVESKVVKEGDLIELGTGHYVLDWKIIKPFMPKFADIRPLKKIWEDYHEENIRIKKQSKKMTELQSLTPIFTTGNIAVSVTAGAMGHINVCFITVPLVLIGFFLMIKNYINRKNDTSIDDGELLLTEFQHNYICPTCKNYLGPNSYDIISQRDKCPHCQAIYKK